MSLRPSGSRDAIELLIVETEHFEFVLKGKVDYSKHIPVAEMPNMSLLLKGTYTKAFVYDALQNELVEFEQQGLYPIFFENGLYEVIIMPKDDAKVSFYHEYEPFKRAISKVDRFNLFTGNLHFKNEVGFSELVVQVDGKDAVAIMIEVFPTKLDYKKDYRALINEVNEQIYNLAYQLIKRTFLKGTVEQYKDPTLTEFYRIVSRHFDIYMKAISQIERQPHHQLVKQYDVVRGDQLKKQDSRTRQYLRKNAGKMVKVSKGISIDGQNYMPKTGLQVKKQVSYDTHENRYVKYTMERMLNRLLKLERSIEQSKEHSFYGTSTINNEAQQIVKQMIKQLKSKLRQSFWREIGKLDRAVNSLVLQMGLGYRDVYQIYIILAKSIVLTGELYKMSVKDIATLYEYWTFIKLGEILKQYCEPISSDIIQVKNDGLFINLQKDKTSTRIFKIGEDEEVTLQYQYNTYGKTPTTVQKPDSVLSIRKKGKKYDYQYIFDAKYRLEVDGSSVGPKVEDINTMHRYRDAIVENWDGGYERTAFGAYVLFPWHDEDSYRQHELYKSIDRVNIGGLPFLPNKTSIVEEIVISLITKSAEQLQAEGILPAGAKEQLVYEINKDSGIMKVADPTIE